jgi:hypothetical protein
MPAKTIELSRPIKWHRGHIKEIVLREPKYRDFMDLGLPTTWVSVPGGGFEQENVQALAEWIERLCDCDPNALELLTLKDTLALRGAVRDFFIASQEKTASPPSTDSSEGSSSNSESTLGPSTI